MQFKIMTIYDKLMERGFDTDEDIIQFDGYDNACIGITDDNRLVYDYSKLVLETMKMDSCSRIDAIEWVDFNILGMKGNNMPVIMYSLWEEE